MISLAFMVVLLTGVLSTNGYVRNCYYTNWSQYSVGFFPANIDPSLCDQITYAFAKLQNNTLGIQEWNDEIMYERINALKLTFPSLKTLIAVGGYTGGTLELTKMLANESTRATFITSAISHMERYNFDGISLDFQFPAHGDSPLSDKEKYGKLCQELRAAFDKHSRPLLLSLSVGVSVVIIDRAYDIPVINPAVDYINLMSFAFHGTWDKRTGHNAGLHCFDQNCVEGCAKYWVDQKASPSKIIIGVSASGQQWTLVDPTDDGVGAAATGHSAPTFAQVCGYFNYPSFRETFDDYMDQAMVPYATWASSGGLTYWVSYDNMDSVAYKAKLVKAKGYAGSMFFSLDQDDFRGQMCQKGSYPLLRVLSSELSRV